MYLLFDIGGTNTRLALSDDGKTFSRPHIYKTPQDPEEGIEQIADFVKGKGELRAIGGGIAGPVDREKGMLVNSPNLPAWTDFPLKERFEDRFEAPAFIANDSQIVGLGEALHGPGKGKRVVAYMTISTGVGGGRIVDGQIDTTMQFSEIGHHVVALEGCEGMRKPCPFCGGKGELEAIISGKAVERATGKKPYEIHDEQFWEARSRELAIGVYNLILFWNPDIVILGGSMMKNPGFLIETVAQKVTAIQQIIPTTPPIVRAELKDIGGLYGAMEFINYQK